MNYTQAAQQLHAPKIVGDNSGARVLPLVSPRLKELTAPFEMDDLDWRVQRSGLSNGRPWALVLAYVDARAVQNRLDEVVGPENWTAQYRHIPGGVMCDLSIRCGDEWVTKSDGSPETNIEAFKGGISKSLVRAASVWGIGRYLYRLSDNFATFVEKRTHGAREVRIEGQNFYWITPELPAWALAAGASNAAPVARTAVPRQTLSVAQGPSAQSMVPSAATIAAGPTAVSLVSAPSADPSHVAQYFQSEAEKFDGDYVVSFGRKYFGKRLADIPADEIAKYRNWLNDDALKSGKAVSGKAKEFLAASESYLAQSREQSRDPSREGASAQATVESEEVPF